jgi:hypothetical protein
MATTTPNYGWTVPTSTDLVKDGATAIETLGDAIDASMNTALGTKKAGMVLLSSVAFSAVSSVSFPTNTFTATYSNYLFMFDITGSTALNVTGRLRAAGTDNTSTIYGSTSWSGSSSVAASGSASATSWSALGQAYDADMKRNIVSFTLCQPQSSTRFTYGHAIYISDINGTPFPAQTYVGTNVTTSFDSITFGTNTGTISGSISCYGFNE